MASTAPLDEQRLLDRLAAGDRRAAEALVDTTYRQVYAGLVRLCGGDADLATDLTQETYRKAWSALDRFDRRSRLGTWLYRIAYTTFLNHIRRPQRLEPLDECSPGHQLTSPEIAQDELLRRSEVSTRLRRAVIGLPEDLRFTVTARFWGEQSVRDIAHHERVTGAAIRKRLKKAMHALRVALAEDAA